MAAGPNAAGPRRPRLLATGFGPFPGAPANPTEWLIGALERERAVWLADAEFRTEVLPVDYAAVPERLAAIGKAFAPDIAVHFGLSGRVRSFRLERLARNEIRARKPDASGRLVPAGPIRAGLGDCSSTLPLKEIRRALAGAGLPVSWSEDAGGYVCNYLFYLSGSAACPGFAPAMAGFLHVPPAQAMPSDELLKGARVVLTTCLEAWRAR